MAIKGTISLELPESADILTDWLGSNWSVGARGKRHQRGEMRSATTCGCHCFVCFSLRFARSVMLRKRRCACETLDYGIAFGDGILAVVCWFYSIERLRGLRPSKLEQILCACAIPVSVALDRICSHGNCVVASTVIFKFIFHFSDNLRDIVMRNDVCGEEFIEEL